MDGWISGWMGGWVGGSMDGWVGRGTLLLGLIQLRS